MNLLEILISLFILSVSLLTIDATSILALKKVKAAYYFTVATQQLNLIVEQLKNTKNLSVKQFTTWNQQNRETLPQGHGVINGHYPQYQIHVFWGNYPHNICSKNLIGMTGCLQKKVLMDLF